MHISLTSCTVRQPQREEATHLGQDVRIYDCAGQLNCWLIEGLGLTFGHSLPPLLNLIFLVRIVVICVVLFLLLRVQLLVWLIRATALAPTSLASAFTRLSCYFEPAVLQTPLDGLQVTHRPAGRAYFSALWRQQKHAGASRNATGCTSRLEPTMSCRRIATPPVQRTCARFATTHEV